MKILTEVTFHHKARFVSNLNLKFCRQHLPAITKVVQGHDGSIFVAYNDFRDDLLLELEKEFTII